MSRILESLKATSVWFEVCRDQKGVARRPWMPKIVGEGRGWEGVTRIEEGAIVL